MRIALKKLRYVVEAAQAVLGRYARERARRMHTFQQLLGDTRDLELLRTRLEKWATKRGKIIAIAPALEDLQEKREGLMQKIVESAAALDNIFPEEHLKPTVEKTLAITASETAATDGTELPPHRMRAAAAR
jgi:CHAD domain-containing protein